MTTEKVKELTLSKKKGAWFTIEYKSEKNGYVKTTKSIVRLIPYKSKNNGEEKVKKANNDIHLTENLIFNTNTNKTRLQVFLTKCPNHKPKSVYEYLGNEITKEEYYEGTGKKPSNITEMFTINVENIIAIY